MSGINKTILVGHIGENPDFRRLADETAVLSFPFATSEYILKNGIRTEQTEWHNIVMWRSLAEVAQKLLQKGKLIYIEGKLRTRSYDDKTKMKRYITEVIADHFVLLGRNSDFEPVEQYREHL